MSGCPVTRHAGTDPVFQAIEAHRTHWSAYAAVLGRTGRFPRFASKKDAERTAARDLYWNQSDALLSTMPTTAAGVLAFARYVATLDTNEKEPPFPISVLMETVATALAGLAVVEAPS